MRESSSADFDESVVESQIRASFARDLPDLYPRPVSVMLEGIKKCPADKVGVTTTQAVDILTELVRAIGHRAFQRSALHRNVLIWVVLAYVMHRRTLCRKKDILGGCGLHAGSNPSAYMEHIERHLNSPWQK